MFESARQPISNGNSHADSHSDTNGNDDRNTKSYSYSKGYSGPEASPDSASKALRVTVIIDHEGFAGIDTGEKSRF